MLAAHSLRELRALGYPAGQGRGSLSLARATLRFIYSNLAGGFMILSWYVAGMPSRTTPLFLSRFELLGFAAACAPQGGLWLEFGVYQGASINFLATRAPGEVVGFDSFEGLPADWTRSFPKGSFALKGSPPTVAGNVRLVKGMFGETVRPFLEARPGTMVSLAHVDSDLYSSAKEVLSLIASRMGPGTVVVFDEFATGYPDDEARAFREFLRDQPRRFRYLGGSLNGSVAVQFLT